MYVCVCVHVLVRPRPQPSAALSEPQTLGAPPGVLTVALLCIMLHTHRLLLAWKYLPLLFLLPGNPLPLYLGLP